MMIFVSLACTLQAYVSTTAIPSVLSVLRWWNAQGAGHARAAATGADAGSITDSACLVLAEGLSLLASLMRGKLTACRTALAVTGCSHTVRVCVSSVN